jgi:hypothetical protein
MTQALLAALRQLAQHHGWEARHGGLLGLKYVLAAVASPDAALLHAVLPAAIAGIQVGEGTGPSQFTCFLAMLSSCLCGVQQLSLCWDRPCERKLARCASSPPFGKKCRCGDHSYDTCSSAYFLTWCLSMCVLWHTYSYVPCTYACSVAYFLTSCLSMCVLVAFLPTCGLSTCLM